MEEMLAVSGRTLCWTGLAADDNPLHDHIPGAEKGKVCPFLNLDRCRAGHVHPNYREHCLLCSYRQEIEVWCEH